MSDDQKLNPETEVLKDKIHNMFVEMGELINKHNEGKPKSECIQLFATAGVINEKEKSVGVHATTAVVASEMGATYLLLNVSDDSESMYKAPQEAAKLAAYDSEKNSMESEIDKKIRQLLGGL